MQVGHSAVACLEPCRLVELLPCSAHARMMHLDTLRTLGPGHAGHSLGGGIALCLLVKFIDLGFLPNWEVAGAVTFGAPLVLRSQDNDNSVAAEMLQHYLPHDCRCCSPHYSSRFAACRH